MRRRPVAPAPLRGVAAGRRKPRRTAGEVREGGKAPQLSTSWRLLDGTQFVSRLIAEGSGVDTTLVADETVWSRLVREHGQART
jgi:hypothetical protein